MYLNLFYACWIVLHLNSKHVIDELEQQEGSILFKVQVCSKTNGPLAHCFVGTHYEQKDKNEI